MTKRNIFRKNLIFIGLIAFLSCQENSEIKEDKTIESEEIIVLDETESDSSFIEKNKNVKALNQIDRNGWQQGYWMIFGKDWPEKGFPADGKIEEGNYRDGKKIGHWIYWNKDNSIQSESIYTNGELNGQTVYYDFVTDTQTDVYLEWEGLYQFRQHPFTNE